MSIIIFFWPELLCRLDGLCLSRDHDRHTTHSDQVGWVHRWRAWLWNSKDHLAIARRMLGEVGCLFNHERRWHEATVVHNRLRRRRPGVSAARMEWWKRVWLHKLHLGSFSILSGRQDVNLQYHLDKTQYPYVSQSHTSFYTLRGSSSRYRNINDVDSFIFHPDFK